MIFHVFTVLDNRSHIHSPPFLTRHTGEAVRSFTELVNDERSSVSKYPADFQLIQIATFNDELGVFQNIEPVYLGAADQYKRTNPQLKLLQDS